MNPIQMTSTFPPPPPSDNELLVENFINVNIYGSGRFDYIKNEYRREMLQNAWLAITLTESWGFVKQKIESFMLSNHTKINIIYSKMEELGYTGHSGFSFGSTMRDMQFISQNGEQEYIKHIELSEKCTETN